MLKKIILILLLFSVVPTFGQGSSVKEVLKNASKVYLISHKTCSMSDVVIVELKEDGTEKELDKPDWIVNEKPNESLQTEKIELNKEQINQLIPLFKINTSGLINIKGCFDPHHTILIEKGSELYYIEICFNCNQMVLSPQFKNTLFSDDVVPNLMVFFESCGIKQFYKH